MFDNNEIINYYIYAKGGNFSSRPRRTLALGWTDGDAGVELIDDL